MTDGRHTTAAPVDLRGGCPWPLDSDEFTTHCNGAGVGAIEKPMPADNPTDEAASVTVRVPTATARAEGVPPVVLPETWRDWGGPEPAALLSRDELVTRLQVLGIDADGDTVRYWEAVGALPRSIKRWHEGATRAVYPDWAVPLVLGLRELQDAGLTLAEIGPVLREVHKRAKAEHEPGAHFADVLTGEVLGELSNRVLYEPARRFYLAFERLTGAPIDRLHVNLTTVGPERTMVASYHAETVEGLRRPR